MTDLWATGLGTPAHVVGIVGSALIVLSLVYSLRKRKWGVRWWRMRRWLSIHHWAGFIGGVMVLGHTLGNMEGLAYALVPLMVVVLASSSIYFLERRADRPLREATEALAQRRRERGELDGAYRALYEWGQGATPDGTNAYRRLMEKHEEVVRAEARVKGLQGRQNPWAWWRRTHLVATFLLLGVGLVHVWAKLYFGGELL